MKSRKKTDVFPLENKYFADTLPSTTMLSSPGAYSTHLRASLLGKRCYEVRTLLIMGPRIFLPFFSEIIVGQYFITLPNPTAKKCVFIKNANVKYYQKKYVF